MFEKPRTSTLAQLLSDSFEKLRLHGLIREIVIPYTAHAGRHQDGQPVVAPSGHRENSFRAGPLYRAGDKEKQARRTAQHDLQ